MDQVTQDIAIMAQRCADDEVRNDEFMTKINKVLSLNGISLRLKNREIYSTIEARLESFNNRITTIKVALLAIAGCFYNKISERITCFYCSALMDETYKMEDDFLEILKLHENLYCPYWNKILETFKISEFIELIWKNNERTYSQPNSKHKNCNTVVERFRTFNDLVSEQDITDIMSGILAIAGYFIEKNKLVCCYCGVSADIFNQEIQLSEIHKIKKDSCPVSERSKIKLKIINIESLNNLSRETVRFRSFKNYQSNKLGVTFDDDLKKKFARIGLYWTQNDTYKEEIKCYFCHFRLVALHINDTDPVGLHYKFQSSCVLFNRQQNDNIPIDDQQFQESISIKPFFLQYKKTVTRLNEFQDFTEPLSGILAMAGFFKHKESDKIKCFFCAVVADRKEVFNIFRAHKDENKFCPFYKEWTNWHIALLGKISKSKTNELNETICPEKYYSEAERLNSFEGYASKCSIVVFTVELREQYARAGFYWTKTNEEIRCSFCNVKLKSLTERDIDPIVTHLRKNVSCNLMRLDEPRNIPMKKNQTLAKSLFRTPFLKHYRNVETRLESFQRSRLEDEVDETIIYSLGLAGFFNINGKNKVVCFYCYFEADISDGRHRILRDHQKNLDICENKKPWIVTGKNTISNFYLETERRKTFQYYVSSNQNLDFDDDLRDQYALVGFYSTSGETEEIKCAFCDLTLDSLSDDGKDPAKFHRSNSNSCNLMRLQAPRNIPINDELLQKKILQTPLYPLYEKIEARLASFDKLVCNDERKLELLVFTGYYQFIEDATKIKCVYCDDTADIKDDFITIINKHHENNKYCPSYENFKTVINTLCDVFLD